MAKLPGRGKRSDEMVQEDLKEKKQEKFRPSVSTSCKIMAYITRGKNYMKTRVPRKKEKVQGARGRRPRVSKALRWTVRGEEGSPGARGNQPYRAHLHGLIEGELPTTGGCPKGNREKCAGKEGRNLRAVLANPSHFKSRITKK